MRDEIGTYGVFFIAGGLLLLGTPILFFFMPETRGKDLAEIQTVFIGNERIVGKGEPSTDTMLPASANHSPNFLADISNLFYSNQEGEGAD